uniref:Cubilin n=1 Tax=Drosophila rhopaloa TaxID=1041015 RepID=A0A6P4EJQ7_DRORH
MLLKLLKLPFVLVLCLQIVSVKGSRYNVEQRAQLVRQSNDNLLLEAAKDQNVTLRLMGESATVTINDVDLLKFLRRRQRIIADRQALARREPLSIDAFRDQIRDTERKMKQIQQRVLNAKNSTRRGRLNQRILRRQLQRVELVSKLLDTLYRNLYMDECVSSPCQNGGTCHDAYNGFQCECTSSWQGDTCTEDVNECATLAGTDLAGCLNNGQCINTPGSYRCVCRNGFSGSHCRLRSNSCIGSGSRELCGEHGTCIQAGNSVGYVCICDQGWTWADANMTSASPSACTRDVDECEPRVNPCHDVCINLPGSFRCGPCPPGYTGDGRFCRDIDECAGEDNGGCSLQPRVACTNTEGSHRCGRCPPGWTGDGRTCKAADSNSCNDESICHPLAKCEYLSDTVVCTCPLGSFGHGYGADGCTTDSNRLPCEQHPCQNNGTCVQNGRGTTCICQPGYLGAVCNSSDACHPSPCLNGGTCRLLPNNKYQCSCRQGYTGTSCSHRRFFCGATIRGPSGQLHYPPIADEHYQANERCPFIIRTLQNMVLNVTFTKFNLQDSTDCSDDFLQLNDGQSLASRIIGRFCGSRLPLQNGSVISSQEQVFFWFRSDNETQGEGFELTWNSLPFACGETINLTMTQTGVVRSPGYPGQARPGLDCRWQLTAPFGRRLLLRFYEISLGSTETAAVNCSQDSLIVYDSDRQLLRACQSLQPSPLYSSSNSLRMDFHTDAVRADSSFQMHYEVVPAQPGCGGVYTESRGRISGYMNAEVCLYLIEQPQETQVKLVFDQVNLIQSENCSMQKIEIFDGRTPDSPLMQRFCGRPEVSELKPLISSSNVILVRYEYPLNGIKLEKSFDFSYSRVCTGSFGGMGGIISTPNYPHSYLDDMTCTYNLTGPINRLAHITITDLSLGTVNNENETTYLDVYLSHDEKRHIIKSAQNLTLIAHSNRASLVFHGSGSGRGMRMEYHYMNRYCGGFLDKPGKKIYQPVPTSCQWIIDIPGKKRIIIKSLIYESNIFVYDNSTVPGTLLATNSKVVDDVFDGDLLTINISNEKRRGRSDICSILFEMVEQDSCGGTFTGRNGYIKSPNWPKAYGNSEECEWILRAPLGHRLELVVKNFTLEKGMDGCMNDWLEIRNGDSESSPLIGRYCSTDIPSRLPSFGNAMHLKFRSDGSIQYKGFLLNWQQTGVGCGGKLSSSTGSIHSPHLLEGNRGVLSCDWQIVVAEGSRVDLQLESRDERLCIGHLAIYDGPTILSNKLVIRCNGTTAQPLQSTGNRVLVRYDVSHESPDGTGFVLNYQTNCRVRLEDLQGAIESPNFPENYPPNLDCEWDIRAGGGKNQLQIVFSHLQLESFASLCLHDKVTFTDMWDNNVIKIKNYCRLNGIAPITTAGNRLLVRFQSDFSFAEQGFRIEYKRIGCGEHFHAALGSFESPKAPFSVDMDCVWTITALEESQIVLLLRHVHFEGAQGDCSEADSKLSVSAPNGFNSSVMLYQTCRDQTEEQTLISPGNELKVRFASSSAPGRKYFAASFSQRTARCGGYISASSGMLATPGFHNQQDSSNVANYSSSVECLWTVEVTKSYGMILRFEQFNLTSSDNCSLSSVELIKLRSDDKEQILEKACDDVSPMIRRFFGQKLRVRFKAEAGTWGRFAMHFERMCGGPLRTGEGYLQSRLDEDCEWLVSSPEGSKLSLSINQLECPKCAVASSNCPVLQLINDDDEDVLYELCRDHPANLIVPANNVRIVTIGIRLQAQYSTFENSCGGNITSARGSLSSPNYPDSYPSNIECVWSIEARPGNALEINFEAMDIVRSEHCNEDFLELRSGVQGQLLGLYCDRKLPESPLVVNTDLWIKFRSSPGNTAGGFRLRWSYVHNIEITMSTNGTIEPPPPLLVKGEDQPFTWRIFTERNKVLVLLFEEYISGLSLFDGYDDSALEVNIAACPWTFTSSSNVVYLKTINAEISEFRLKWHVLGSHLVNGNLSLTTKECTQELIASSKPIELFSPGYPHGYAPNLKCEWTIRPEDPSQHILAYSYEADLEVFNECFADYLKIQSSPDLNHWTDEVRVCKKPESKGAITPVHGTPNLRLQFHSDVSINGTGFKASLRTACGSNMTDIVGTISVPYEDTGECAWHIDVRPGRKIDITIRYNFMTSPDDCEVYGLIYDGLDDHAPLLKHSKFCAKDGFRITSFRTSSSHAYIKFHLGRQNKLIRPWTLTYREFNECNGEIKLTQQAPNFVVMSPGYPNLPQPHSECTWLVMAPAGETIAANFDEPFEISARHCDKENVELFDGSTKLAPSLIRTCRKPQATVRSTGNLLLVHYQSQLNEPSGGFRLNLSLSTCGGQFTGSNGILTSENYPSLGGYTKPSLCVYSIRFRKDTFIQLNITDLHLPFDPNGTSSNDTSDRLEIVDLADPTKVLYVLDGSTITPNLVTLSTNAAAIRFVAITNVNNYRGFKLQYKRVLGTCSQDINGVAGDIVIPPLSPTTWLRFCRLTINVPKGQRVRLNLLNLADIRVVTPSSDSRFLIRQHSTNLKHFAFYNDPNSLSKITEFRVNNYNGSGIIESTDNFMLVVIMTHQLDLSSTALKFHYSSSEPTVCPPEIGDQSAGSLSIQTLLQLPNYYCIIKFSGAAGTTITFKVEEYLFQTVGGPAVLFYDEVQRHPFKSMYANVTNSFVSLATTGGHVTLLNTASVKLRRFRATYRRHSCGGRLQAAEGLIIQSPGLLNTLGEEYGELECLWTLSNSDGYVLEGIANLTDRCDREYIVIFSGQTEISRICRGMTVNSTILQSPTFNILFHSDTRLIRSSQFRLQIRRSMSVGNEVRLEQAPSPPVTITSKDYLKNTERIWEFVTKTGLSLKLHFQDRFFIVMSPNCTNDRLTIERYDQSAGAFVEVTSLCGRETPVAILVPSSRIRVIFRTNSNMTGDGFSFQVFPSCDAVLQATADVQTLDTPPWRGYRWQQFNCSYVFLASNEHQLVVSVKNRGMPLTSLGCSKSYFEGYRLGTENQETSLGKLCPEFEVNGYGKLRLQYLTSVTRMFELQYHLIRCGGDHNASFTLRPPQDEENGVYAHNKMCEWRVFAPPQHAIVIEFKYFDMEKSTNCLFDSLAIYRGKIADLEQRIVQLCGNQTNPPTIMVDSNEALIALSTDSSINSRGFLASVRFTPNCNEHLILDSEVPRMNLMRSYRINVTNPLLCYFRALVTPDYRLSLEVRKLKLNDPSCLTCSYLEIYDGPQKDGQKLGRYYGAGANRTKVFSSYLGMEIKLSATTRQDMNISFELILQLQRTLCGKTEYDMRLNETIKLGIQYDNSTSSYEGSIQCTWIIKNEGDLEFDFQKLRLKDISQRSGKCEDYLKLSKPYFTRSFCGQHEKSFKLIEEVGESGMQLTFHSDKLEESQGFEVIIRRKPNCNRNYTELSQIINTKDLINCTEYIRVPKGYSITIYVLSLDFDRVNVNYFNVTDLNSNKTIFTTSHVQWETVARITTTNELRLDSRGVMSLQFFYFSTSNQFPSGCGGELAVHGSMGSYLENPSYEGRNSSLCSWSITVPAGGNLRFSFQEFNMGSETNCDLDNIRFYGNYIDGRRLEKTLCGSKIPNYFSIANNNVTVIAKKSPNFDGLGFKMDINHID